jgi:hypothetical protein
MKISDIILKENDEMFAASWRSILPSFIKYGDQVLPRLEKFGEQYSKTGGPLADWADDNDYDSIFGYIVDALDTNYHMLLAFDGVIQDEVQGGVPDVYYKFEDGDIGEYRDAWEGFKRKALSGQLNNFEVEEVQNFGEALKKGGGQIQEEDEMFAAARRPPTNASALLAWAKGNAERAPYLLIAEFALNNGMTLRQALETAQYFDYSSEDTQEQYGITDDEMSDLFDAYEAISNAWNTDPSGDTSDTESWEALGEASFQFDLDDEPEPPKKTQTRDKPKFNHDPFQQQAAQPLANRPEEPRGAEQPAAPRMRQATAAATRRAAGNIEPTDQMRDMLSRMRNIEIDPDLADYPQDEPTFDVDVNVNTENLPAVAGQAIAAAGETSPEFHQVARLPGNMSRMIRQLGKSLFGSMTNTPTEDIYMIGNLGGQGPNTRQEVNAVANFVRENGENLGAGDIDFNAIMPGYNAETHQFVAAGIRWLLVKDFAGEYIYAWPEADSKTPSSHAQLGNAPKRLR